VHGSEGDELAGVKWEKVNETELLFDVLNCS